MNGWMSNAVDWHLTGPGDDEEDWDDEIEDLEEDWDDDDY